MNLLYKECNIKWRACAPLQAAYHGFGVTVMPNQLKTSQPMSQAIARILNEPEFLVSASQLR